MNRARRPVSIAGRRILETHYRAAAHWAHPIRNAITGNAVLAPRDRAWRQGQLSDLAFAIETRLRYLPRIITFIDDNIGELHAELVRSGILVQLLRDDIAFTFKNERAVDQVLFGATTFLTESRACFENLAEFYKLFLETYCNKKIGKPQSYNVVARSTGKWAWASALKRVRGDLIHARSLFLAFDMSSAGWPPVFSMNWRPGHFGRTDRIELRTLGEVWTGLFSSASAMRGKIARIASSRRSAEE